MTKLPIMLKGEGNIKTYGKVITLIKLGTGFNYELTGKENVVTNVTILGFKKSKIKEIFQLLSSTLVCMNS